MWARKNFHNLDDFIAAAKGLGFNKIELNHQVNSTMLEETDLSKIQVNSIHEPCPADIPVETLKDKDWLVSALDEEKRHRGVEAVKRSIDLAYKLNAGVIVVHAGNALADLSQERELRTMLEAGHKQTRDYQDLQDKLRQARAVEAKRRLEAVIKSLTDLLEVASRFRIRLGIENRYHFGDIPSPEEMEPVLSLAGNEHLGFIYDVGHAQALDRLGFFPQQEWLERFSTRIIGVHIHDVNGVNDHFAPGLGEVNFDQIAPFIPEKAFRTLELKPKTTPEQITSGMKYLVDHGWTGLLG